MHKKRPWRLCGGPGSLSPEGARGIRHGIEAEINPFGPGGAAGTADVSIVGVSATSDTMHGVSLIS